MISILQELYWLPVTFQAQFKVLVFTFEALYSVEEVYLKDYLMLRVYSTFTIIWKKLSACTTTDRSTADEDQREGFLHDYTSALERPAEVCQALPLQVFCKGLKMEIYRLAF